MMDRPTVHAVVLGDDVNTDLLHPPRFFGTAREAVLPGFLAGFPPEYAARFAPGDLLVGGRNFGCGSSREAYVRAFQYAGVSCVIAHSFSRIFYRNLINAGIPVARHDSLYQLLAPWAEVRFDREAWTLTEMSSGTVHDLQPPEAYLQRILSAGGLLRYLRLEEQVR